MNIRVITIFNVLLIILHIILLVVNYPSLANKVPSHVGISGQVDQNEDKSFIFQILIVNMAVFAIIEFFRSKPHILNYGVPVTEQNKARLYKGMQSFLTILNLSITIIFFLISSYLYLKVNSIFLWGAV